MTASRLLLIVAPQNAAMGHLDQLEGAAQTLADLLQQEHLGYCSPALADEGALLYGAAVTQTRIETAVRTAARRAGDVGATLILAFLGHGMAPQGRPELYMMGADAQPDVLGSAVNVGHLLVQAAEQPGVNGVIGLVDTCHAAGAVPDVKALVAGVRGGRTRLSLLMASGAEQEAYDLVFTRELTKLLRQGIPGAGEHFEVSALRDKLRHTVLGQDIVSLEHDGDHFAVHDLWLAHNPRGTGADGPGPGLLGAEDLRSALDAIGLAAAWPEPWSLHELDRVRYDMHAIKESGVGGLPALVHRALHVVDGLRICLVTQSFLTSWVDSKLTTQRLRKALPLLPADAYALVSDATGTALLRDLLELLVLRAPRVGDSRTALLTRFVVALGSDAGLDLCSPGVTAWADACGARIELNDAQEELLRGQTARRLRLVVSLHATVADDWPESLSLWLLDGGTVCERAEIACAPTQTAVEAKLAQAVAWARKHARPRQAPLRHVDVAVPTSLLLRWRPEETDFGVRLGVNHDVVVRWSMRLNPPAHLWWINDHARAGLEQMSTCAAKAPVDWLAEQDAAQAADLAEQLRAGRYTRAVAFSHRPAHLKQAMELLLAYVPVLLWPDSDRRFSPTERALLDMVWDRLPTELAQAYRRRWQGGSVEPSDRLADLRTVWHDLEWLDFCSWFDTQHAVHGSIA
ncbi:caspase family protein [Streptomyces marokkonensis]|uniref:vWA-MoxR associated conflict system protein n=1 Tax=Streptomyces marokkonensis TaxID=324855 RepID=UPI0011F367CE|nr:caspase family protein [Streptomyces marokkonensis]